ncbi:hypothetical protein BC777_1199 [Yoonia maricola]|uniref:Uncharacterized protein n=1 Tax=Yoonia maricola TaxID=420999 RepID=A0A2M8WN43_9RHOB|nr:hypothetical protein [Yoonia maricola]PJI92351.1 hypothetical protein BC777_1199 [Yoonia maricola]
MTETTLVTGTDEAETFTFTPTADDGIVTIDNFGADDSVVIGDDTYDAEYLYHFASAQRALSMDVDSDLIGEGDTQQIVLYANSAEDGEVASYDEVFAVINVASDTGASPIFAGTDDADTFEFTASSDDGIAAVSDFGAEDTVVIGDQTYSADDLYAAAYSQRSLSADVDTDLIDAGDTQQIVLYANSAEEGDIASYDELFAVIDITVDDGWIA